MNHKYSKAEFFLAATLLLAAFSYGFSQPAISLNDGHPYDTQSYFTMAEQVAAGEGISELKPFAYRVALPYLVGTFFKDDLDLGFKSINLVFGLLTLILMIDFFKYYKLKRSTILVLLILFVVNPNSVFRFSHFIPAYTDPAGLFFVLLFMVMSYRVKNITLSVGICLFVLAFIGVLFREIVLCGVLVFIYAQCFELKARSPFLVVDKTKKILICGLPLVGALSGIFLTHQVIKATGGYLFSDTIVNVIKQLADQPSIYSVSWLTAFGVIPVVLLIGLNRKMLSFLSHNQSVAIFLFGSILLSLASGFHTDRIVFWAYPAVLLLFGYFIENSPVTDSSIIFKLLFYSPLVIVQAISNRVFSSIPDDPLGNLFAPGPAEHIYFAPYGNVTLGHIYGSTMIVEDRITLLYQFGALAVYLAMLLLIINKYSKRNLNYSTKT
jgi:hypothetical protein